MGVAQARHAAAHGRTGRVTPASACVVGMMTLVALVFSLLVIPTSARADLAWRSGVYCSSSDSPCIDSFASWRGRPVAVSGTYLASYNWPNIEAPDIWLTPWTTHSYKASVVITVPLLPSGGDAADSTPTMAEGATGAYDSHFVTLATRLVGAGLGSSEIRLGHELNGTWYRWSAKPDPTSFLNYWRHAVTAMRSVPGASFTFDWSVANAVTSWDARTAYPGDAYVDTIGVDLYDYHYGTAVLTPAQRWAYILSPGGSFPQGLTFWSDFATLHNKPIAFPEWGLVGAGATMAAGGAGGDDPYFIEQMTAWFASHRVAYEIYFDRDPTDGNHAIDGGRFPNAAATYVRLLGDPSTALGPSPLPPPPPSSSTPTPSPTDTEQVTRQAQATQRVRAVP